MGFLDGKVALVTGAAEGLGVAFANAAAAAGAKVAICDIRDNVDERASQIGDAHGVETASFHADTGVPEDCWRVVDSTMERFGRIDVLINNAGTIAMTSPTDPVDKSIADYDLVMNVNNRAYYLFARAVWPIMQEQGGGEIVNIATDHIFTQKNRPTGGGWVMDTYDSSKWGLNGFLLSWSKAGEPHNIRVNGICLGATDSHMLRGFTGEENLTPEVIASWMKPADVAQVVMDLIEDGRSGYNIPVWVDDPVVLTPQTDDFSLKVGVMKSAFEA
ncbi:MAG: SDR family NAD(P)-dependent oxidoreductase [Chloroflexi bacterium]|nr:SDR family NAD(P)-dependent oxidoreductase [Chloroflexota bacterium]